jgi:FAD/FMN-containing dehydrogenase/Fe-S oxidoreductase
MTSSTDNDTDVRALAAELRSSVRGEVRFDDGSRALYATDASNYRQVPIGVVIPRTVDDIISTVVACHGRGVPVLSRGGGTSLAGQCCNVAVVIDCSKYLRSVLDINSDQKLARVQPGVVLDDLRHAAERSHLTFGPDPATHNRCTLGGMIGNNSCGVHSVMAGMTADNVEELEVLTYDGLRLHVGQTTNAEMERIVRAGGRRGEIYTRLRALRDRYADQIRTRFPDIPRRVSGYNLPALLPENGFHVARALVGSEGTCVTVLEATVRLVHNPPARVVVALGFTDMATGCDRVPEILAHQPVGLEGFDARLIDSMKRKNLLPADVALLPPGAGWLLAEFGGETPQEAEESARKLVEAIQRSGAQQTPSTKVFADHEQQQRIWAVREAALGATAIVPGEHDMWPGWEDSAVPPAKLGAYLRDLRQLLLGYGYDASFYGHVGQGCTHMRIDFDFRSAPGVARFRSFMNDAADLVIRYGGSLSGEHGDGQARAELLPKMFGPELVKAFGEFKAIWDPDGKMNPGKVVDPARMDQNLRLAIYNPPEPKTHFRFQQDGGSFAHAAMRCVGVGLCRREAGGTMCPSFMATREEMHSTRGRARLLYEMLQGDVVHGGWRDEHVREALDLCLACKGCKGECPVNVDMASYKAEFLAHYYAGRLRPPSAYAFGLIMYWARLASRVPALVNFATQTPLLSDVAKRLAGIAPERRIPRFASQPFKTWFRRRTPPDSAKPQVVLWPDTFNNYFHPQTAQAAVAVLEAAGFNVLVPVKDLCCGRPLYDYGMLDQARLLLRQVLDALRPCLRAGVSVVGLEPSCVAVFRDELLELFPDDPDARRLSEQSFLLSEFLVNKAKSYHPPRLAGRTAVVHGHCHHKALMGMADEEAILGQLGLTYQVPDSGCCGMAGGFGFEREHYNISMTVGERVLLPAVRGAAKNTLIIADGFSCREQIAQATDRQALHLAQVIQMAMESEA